jgi:hypothetical protein
MSEREHSLSVMTMLMLSKTVLRVSTSERILRKSTLIRKKLTKRMKQIFSGRVNTKNMNERVKLSVNHRSKGLISSKHLSSRLQEIDPM